MLPMWIGRSARRKVGVSLFKNPAELCTKWPLLKEYQNTAHYSQTKNKSTIPNNTEDSSTIQTKWSKHYLPTSTSLPASNPPMAKADASASFRLIKQFPFPTSKPMKKANSKGSIITVNTLSNPPPLASMKKKEVADTSFQDKNSSIYHPEPNSLENESITAVNSICTPSEKPRRKLRARKAVITLSPTAVDHLRRLLDSPHPKMIRITVKNRGCSGLTYHLDYVDEIGKFDEQVDQDGVKVLIDSKALFSIIGSEMDWVDDKLSSRFVFKNPNSKGQCGCGESFMI
ncbi:hypothetical protein NADFUDRAFT_82913 [Nadsonia fulvescens var. elongata DSM 6958]|uniref:Iron-sulfur assembly protein 1 n=1 Tax=Nadsonia fulvescens var. elongata DSM 6958 TaxID=857566 RepID=A0A1E3PL30_9ASCO|nr:hypothetical protein NADFUDRAFT_82913 [Nadsonia fulvescens var. elongata DSM 6958]